MPSFSLTLNNPLSRTPSTCSRAHSLHFRSSSSVRVQRCRAIDQYLHGAEAWRDQIKRVSKHSLLILLDVGRRRSENGFEERDQRLTYNTPRLRTGYSQPFFLPIPTTEQTSIPQPFQISRIPTRPDFKTFTEPPVGGELVGRGIVSETIE